MHATELSQPLLLMDSAEKSFEAGLKELKLLRTALKVPDWRIKSLEEELALAKEVADLCLRAGSANSYKKEAERHAANAKRLEESNAKCQEQFDRLVEEKKDLISEASKTAENFRLLEQEFQQRENTASETCRQLTARVKELEEGL